MKRVFITAIALGFVLGMHSCKPEAGDAKVSDAETDTIIPPKESQVKLFFEHGGESRYIVDFDTAVINKYGGEQMRAITWGGPLKITQESGTYMLEGIADVVNFDIDPDCSSKFFRFKMPIDSIVPYLASERFSGSYFFSWSPIFDSTAKRFVAEEIWHRGEYNKVLAELKDFNANYGMEGMDSLQLIHFYTRDVFDKEFYFEVWLANNSRRPIDQASIDMTLTEYDGHKSDTALDSVKYENLNILVGQVPPRTFQIIRKTVKNKKYRPSNEVKLRYYDTKQVLKTYKTGSETVMVDKVVK